MNPMTLRIATRTSELALWQANYVGQALQKHHPGLNYTLVKRLTEADRKQQQPLTEMGGKGVFVKELEQALLDNQADIAVHSAKDMPTQMLDALTLACIPQRGPIEDLLVSQKPWDEFPKNGTIGTSSPRRACQLNSQLPHAKFIPIRGNIATRLALIESQNLDGLIVAKAALDRLNLKPNHPIHIFPTDTLLPACGQGALAIECLKSNQTIHTLLEPLNDHAASLCVHTERQLIAALGGHCNTPIAALATLNADNSLTLSCKISQMHGPCLQQARSAPQTKVQDLAIELAQQLNHDGAQQLIKAYANYAANL
jgi:hydroxymethylbilane synthase